MGRRRWWSFGGILDGRPGIGAAILFLLLALALGLAGGYWLSRRHPPPKPPGSGGPAPGVERQVGMGVS